MRTPVQDTLVDVAAMAARTTVPNRERSVRAIRRAIAEAAAEHRGQVHISWVRPLLPSTTTPQLIGAVFSGLHLSGHLVATTRTLPSGGGSGNASKLAKVSRLVKDFTAEETRP